MVDWLQESMGKSTFLWVISSHICYNPMRCAPGLPHTALCLSQSDLPCSTRSRVCTTLNFLLVPTLHLQTWNLQFPTPCIVSVPSVCFRALEELLLFNCSLCPSMPFIGRPISISTFPCSGISTLPPFVFVCQHTS